MRVQGRTDTSMNQRLNRILVIATAIALTLLSACSTPPAATPTATATSTPTAAPTPVAITAATAAQLRATDTFATTQVQRMVWSATGVLWVASTARVDAVTPGTSGITKAFEVQAPNRILAVSPSGIVAVGSGATVLLVDLKTSTTLQTLTPGGVTNTALFFGTKVVLVAGDTIGASVWDVGSGTRTGAISGFQTAAPVYNMVVSPDGARSAWVSRATLQFGDVSANTLGSRIQLEDFIGAYAFAPDGKLFASTVTVPGAGGTLVGRVQLWDPATGAEVRRLNQASIFAALGFAPREHLIATGGEGLTLWSTDDGKSVASMPVADTGKVRQVAFSPDGSMLATIADDGRGTIWRAAAR